MVQLVDILFSGIRDNCGVLMASGTVTSYAAGTNDLQPLYEEFELETEHDNPLTLDAAARVVAYAENRIKLVVTNATGNETVVIDNVGLSTEDVSTEVDVSPLIGVALFESSIENIFVNTDATTTVVSADNEVIVKRKSITAAKINNAVTLPGTACGVTDSFKVGGASGPAMSHLETSDNNGLSSTGGSDNLFFPNGASAPALDGNLGNRTLGVRRNAASTKLPAVVSAFTTTHGLVEVRGAVDNSGTLQRGEGFTGAVDGTGLIFTVTFTNAFTDTPIVVLGTVAGTLFPRKPYLSTVTTNSFQVIHDFTSNNGFYFSAIGERGTA